MSTVPLPEEPNLGQLRKLAKDLQKAVSSGTSALGIQPDPHFRLSAAQTALARHFGFASWPRLRRHVEVINARTWTMPPPATDETLADRFLRLACLNFTDDSPARRAEAARLLADNPQLPATNLAVAAACADVPSVKTLASQSNEEGMGPYGWSPLMYLAYARHDPGVSADAIRQTVQTLLAAGADPNDGRFFLGLPTPFTVLTGVFGGDPVDQPPHPQAAAFARELLTAGADPNDGQTLYNRMFYGNDDHLELLFEFGLGSGDGGPWRRLLGDKVESPREMVAALLDWAVAHDQRDRVALLAANGVDVISPIAKGRSSSKALTPIEIALRNGNRELAAQLRTWGAPEPHLSPTAAFLGAALAGDAAAVKATPTEVIASARAARPGVVVWAAGLGRVDAVELLVAAGFDVNALGRSDIPREQKWQTALHAAVGDGNLELVRSLLALGADVTICDKRFDATPLGWAEHFGRPDLAELLS